MAITISAKSTQKEIVPSGTHVAICYRMIHIGTQEFEWGGETKKVDKVRLSFELPHELRTYGDNELPMAISKEYTLSLHEKANLRKDLESWRGKTFTEDELKSFDLTNLLGVACNLSIVHDTTKSGATYPKITNISALSKGMEKPVQINESFEFNYDSEFNTDWLDNECPDWLRETIKATPEYQERIAQLEGAELDKVLDQKTDDLPF